MMVRSKILENSIHVEGDYFREGIDGDIRNSRVTDIEKCLK